MIRPPPSSPLFPYTTLFRSVDVLLDGRDLVGELEGNAGHAHVDVVAGAAVLAVPLRERGRVLIRVRDPRLGCEADLPRDRKSTRLNSSHANISYAVFCLIEI